MKKSEFISALVMHFPVRHESAEREIEWMEAILGTLVNYEPDILRDAAESIILNRTDRRFPLPAEIRRACEAVRAKHALAAGISMFPVRDRMPADQSSGEDRNSADFKARDFVNGLREIEVAPTDPRAGTYMIASGSWSRVFLAHQTVDLAEREGWARDLRQHLIRVVRRQIAGGLPYEDIDNLMPDRTTIAYWRDRSETYKKAAQWRADMVEKFGSVEVALTRTRSQMASKPTAKSLGAVMRKMGR